MSESRPFPPPWQEQPAPTGPPRIPLHTFNIPALTDDYDGPTWAYQYAVLDRGVYRAYGDQEWVAYGRAQREQHPDGKTQRRRVTITYGPWVDVDAPEPAECACPYGPEGPMTSTECRLHWPPPGQTVGEETGDV